MKVEVEESFLGKLLDRETYDQAVKSRSYRKLYSSRRLIHDLDIVNELDGHTGCVNALSWSKSGNLLASGSDDTCLNIHQYQPDDTEAQFKLSASVATGHTQNIFSVKFMPHSNDRIVITAAGDAQVRIFDLGNGGGGGTTSAASAMAQERRRTDRYSGVRLLSDGDTNAKVYRSHGDRVKRIITESSPHLFLTCSEDGEVRQWDLRQPSSAYPEPRGSRFASDSAVPPALISYKRYNLDLNTISCSASQPHYIALGGAHLHAFLHDRRMTGRDKLQEMGKPLSPISRLSPDEQELLTQATQCVRKFAPFGQKRMKRTDTGHITACKISDARPDEMVVSWSGDHIYSFDLIRNPEEDRQEASGGSPRANRARSSTDRKRKRRPNGSEASLSQEARASSKRRTDPHTSEDTALRIRYQNGQSEDIALPRTQLTEQQMNAQNIAKATVKIRSALFGQDDGSSDSSAQFTNALGHSARILGDIDDTNRDWGYPMDPEPHQVRMQHVLRTVRERTRRFVQGAGTLSRVLGGKLQTTSGSSALLSKFSKIEVRSNDIEMSSKEIFCYDFLKAIVTWLDSGLGQLVEVFTRPSQYARGSKFGHRLPVPEADASIEAIEEHLIPYLSGMATEDAIVNLEANRFETDESRQLFANGQDAVRAFAAALKIPFEDLSSAAIATDDAARIQSQDRQTALRFWAGKVGRGLLLNAAEGLTYVNVDRSFGGLGKVVREVAADSALADALEEVGEEEDEALAAVEVVANGRIVDGANAQDIMSAAEETRQADREGTADSHGRQSTADLEDEIEAEEAYEDDDMDEAEDEDHDDDDEDIDSDDSSEPDEVDGVPATGVPRYIYRSAFERRKLRPKVEADKPCSGNTRSYRGHLNIRTVKDVNYFGPDDDYVVSGSDDGNFFIWDRKTTELINVLEGDGEVVNVIQGHPYETMMAVSGIDHTIKIFSPDARARQVARLGQGVSSHDPSAFSSLAWPPRARHRRPRRSTATTTSEPAVPPPTNVNEEDEEYVAANGLRSRKKMLDAYRIMQSNEAEREGGAQEQVISLPHAQLLQLLFGQLGNVGFMNFE